MFKRMAGAAVAALAVLLAGEGAVCAANLKKLAAAIQKEAQEFSLTDSMAAGLTLGKQVRVNYRETDDQLSSDDYYRAIFVLGPVGKPDGFIFMTRKIENYRYETFYCRTDIRGAPKAAYSETGVLNPDGNLAMNPNSVVKLTPEDPFVTRRLPRELEFWLTGHRRRPDSNPWRP